MTHNTTNMLFFAPASAKLPPDDVKDFLEHVASPRVNRGWEFLLPTDVDFVKKHPDVAHRQNMLWLGIQSKWVPLQEGDNFFSYFRPWFFINVCCVPSQAGEGL